ncbi:membrane protein [Francisella halioticida]|nr:membrane protein [Francisella halioticida]
MQLFIKNYRDGFMKIKKTFTVLLLAVSVLSLSSCWLIIGAVVGAGTIAYVQGEYSMNIDGSLKDVYNGALEAVQSNNDYVITKKDITPTDATIEGNTKVDATNFSIKMEKLTSKASKVTIKFGTFGDRTASATLMDQIQKNIK